MVTVSVGRVFKVIQLDEEQASRFWDNVALADDNGCMVWRGVKAPNGYGHFAAKGTKFLAHRVAWTLTFGRIPTGLVLDHVVCQNRACCNPEHTQPVTQQVNVQRGQAGAKQAAFNRSKTHCVNGHEYSGDNLSTYKNEDCARLVDEMP